MGGCGSNDQSPQLGRESNSKSCVRDPKIWGQVEMEELYITSSSSLLTSSLTLRCL